MLAAAFFGEPDPTGGGSAHGLGAIPVTIVFSPRA
jgi:hypothetical protein